MTKIKKEERLEEKIGLKLQERRIAAKAKEVEEKKEKEAKELIEKEKEAKEKKEKEAKEVIEKEKEAKEKRMRTRVVEVAYDTMNYVSRTTSKSLLEYSLKRSLGLRK